jgi:hypothetical protein
MGFLLGIGWCLFVDLPDPGLGFGVEAGKGEQARLWYYFLITRRQGIF